MVKKIRGYKTNPNPPVFAVFLARSSPRSCGGCYIVLGLLVVGYTPGQRATELHGACTRLGLRSLASLPENESGRGAQRGKGAAIDLRKLDAKRPVTVRWRAE